MRIDQSQPSLLDSCRLGCDWSKSILARPVIQLWCGARNADWQNGWKSGLIEKGSSNCIVLMKISWKTFNLINNCSFQEESLQSKKTTSWHWLELSHLYSWTRGCVWWGCFDPEVQPEIKELECENCKAGLRLRLYLDASGQSVSATYGG